MTNDEMIGLYLRALYEWGADAQTLMVFEEMSELQKELCKHARGGDNAESIADEIADVIIMLEQMMVLHDCQQLVKERKEYKLERLKKRLGGEP
jgi:NTP pyrophosphatase (non-canonical NTP hydrolase)